MSTFSSWATSYFLGEKSTSEDVGDSTKERSESTVVNRDSPAKEKQQQPRPAFTFDDGYKYPTLYEEADEMLQVSLLIYTVTQLRQLAKNQKNISKDMKKIMNKTEIEPGYEAICDGNSSELQEVSSPLDRLLSLPLSLDTCLDLIENNFESIIKELGDDDHDMTVSSLYSIHQRYAANKNRRRCRKLQKKNSDSGSKFGRWWNSTTTTSEVKEKEKEIEAVNDDSSPKDDDVVPPTLIAYGDNNPDKELVYAIGIEPRRKRITLAFRGSVTLADFFTDAYMFMNQQPDPLYTSTNDQTATTTNFIGIHQGFYEYMFKRPAGKTADVNKYEEIVALIKNLFDTGKYSDYKLYVTGHSLGGALATLFSFYIAAQITRNSTNENNNNNELSNIPTPISCISIASPRVGDINLQTSFRVLESRGLVRHLRVANDRDPITAMPKQSVKKMWAVLSPISYIAFKLSDQKFEEKETYHHTGIKLKLLRKSLPATKSSTSANASSTAITTSITSLFTAGDAAANTTARTTDTSLAITDGTNTSKNESNGSETSSSSSPFLYKYGYDIQYSAEKSNKRSSIRSLLITDDNDSNRTTNALLSIVKTEEMPDAIYHMGVTYCDNLKNVKDGLGNITLNELYAEYAVTGDRK